MATTTKPSKPTTNLDFTKVFASNASIQPFTWLDSEYLKGWEAIKQTPPGRQQFDALQSHSDKKENWLYNQYLEGYVDKFLDYLNTVKAPINSPTFTGDPKAPTPSKNDNDTSLATTAFVQTWVADLINRIEAIEDGGGGGEGGGGGTGVGIVAASKSNPGYIKFGNGVIIQWAHGDTGPSGYVTFTLPISFTTMYVGVGNDNSPGSVNNFHIIAVDNSNTSQCTIGGRETDGTSALAGTSIGAIFMGY